MSSSSSSSKPPTPARLSSISTNLLTSILELSHQSSLDISINQNNKSSILKNLKSLREGLIKIDSERKDEEEDDQIILNLRNQYGRILSLVRSLKEMNESIDGLELDLPLKKSRSEPLIDLVENDDDNDHPSSSQPLLPISSTNNLNNNNHLDDYDNDEFRNSSSNHNTKKNKTTRRSRVTIEEDEELMRAQNEDVQLLQRAMIDDQDRTLDQLSTAISRQRDLSLHISSELEVQENLLNELDEGLDHTSTNLQRANRKMNNVFRKVAKDGACWTIFGLVGFLLFLIVLLK